MGPTSCLAHAQCTTIRMNMVYYNRYRVIRRPLGLSHRRVCVGELSTVQWDYITAKIKVEKYCMSMMSLAFCMLANYILKYPLTCASNQDHHACFNFFMLQLLNAYRS